MTSLSYNELKGRTILGKGGREIGELSGILIDADDWRVKSIDIKVHKDALEAMGMKRPMFGTQTITVPISQISRTSDAILLEAELSEVLFSKKN